MIRALAIFLATILVAASCLSAAPIQITPLGDPGHAHGSATETMRCENSGETSAGNIVATFCGSAASGDLALVCGMAEWNVTNAGGWTSDFNSNGLTWNEQCSHKTLTSGDISTGSVTFGLAGGPNSVIFFVFVFVGATMGIREFDTNTNNNNVATTSAATNTDYVVWMGSTRCGGGACTSFTNSRGTDLTGLVGGAGPGVLGEMAGESSFPGGVQTQTWTSNGGGSNFQPNAYVVK